MAEIKKFLLTDDDKDDRELFFEALYSVDPSIICQAAEHGREALHLLTNNGIEKPDLIFIDINMPVMNGWELLNKIKKDDYCHDIPVIIYTTSSEDRDRQIAKDLGALCFVTKPDDFRRVKNMLQVIVSNMKKDSLSSVCREIEKVLTS